MLKPKRKINTTFNEQNIKEDPLKDIVFKCVEKYIKKKHLAIDLTTERTMINTTIKIRLADFIDLEIMSRYYDRAMMRKEAMKYGDLDPISVINYHVNNDAIYVDYEQNGKNRKYAIFMPNFIKYVEKYYEA